MKRFRAKQMTYYDPETKTTWTVWHPQVKFNGRWCFLPSENTKTKLEEARDEAEAYEKAIAALRKLDARESIER
ncbi:hypothetical protein [Paenibacillus apiarius]|uniref:Uncharacterized protein n=1 Tax=Paenibacillus apiarius TaxID=46240 RepID=A0ABT4DX69_9BACL|nr:hypothetical protein [Paenibacillus apiarius]MCY9513286.1 hypothetical protein [Paenibacillus apiarius]MCY9521355.1 hypothetical protein [Paenibacillus apiarius]MCY9554498.1 hypothetical protein [Paenibacillus apiarius]MCY9560702.1 hypothetical protein [Paenibacillus apiarius]MCY9685047.1 hypothetical protein [Paenibacillus apiarius]